MVMSPNETVWLTDLFLTFFGQQWRNKISGFGYTHTSCQLDTFIVGLGVHMGFVVNKKNAEYHQRYPLTLLHVHVNTWKSYLQLKFLKEQRKNEPYKT